MGGRTGAVAGARAGAVVGAGCKRTCTEKADRSQVSVGSVGGAESIGGQGSLFEKGRNSKIRCGQRNGSIPRN